MLQNITDFFQEDAWQKVATDAEDLLREIVEQRSQSESLSALKLRFVRLKLDHLKLRLRNLKQSLQQHLAMLEEQLLAEPDDDVSRYLLAQGAERLGDMWLMESLLARLAHSANPAEHTWSNDVLFEPPSNRSNQQGGSV